MDTICYMMLDRKRNRVCKIWTIIPLLFDGLETSVLHNMICLLNSLIYVRLFLSRSLNSFFVLIYSLQLATTLRPNALFGFLGGKKPPEW
ncbi:hypothetical protein L2E82_31505 [Cichorium intybus]|uniref:Uncharacterized protein n=1 Tax=Cichorium intybus TaxID=13427 RepID=A0ACB9BEZ2_CICIN|nr:hypothetical protein L2E82_31505 [Cichorium intybus]